MRTIRTGCVAMLLSASAFSAPAQEPWRLVVEQRFLLDDGPAEPIKAVRDFAVGRDGRLYVLENTVKQIHVYLPNGRYWRSLSRSGSGPGEIRDANGVVTAPDGSLWLNDHGNARITNLSADGNFLRQMQSHALGYAFRWAGFVDAQGVLHDQLFTAQRQSVERRKLDGTVIDTLPPAKCPWTSSASTVFRAQSKNASRVVQIPFVQQAVVALDPRGAQWCVTGADYALARLDLASGKVTAQAARDIKRVRIPRPLRDAAIERIRVAVSNYESTDADFSLVPNEYPYVTALTVDDRGRLWALRPQADSLRSEFDVFDERGKYLATATLPERINSYLRVLVRGGVLYAVALDADDIPSVVRARITRSPGT